MSDKIKCPVCLSEDNVLPSGHEDQCFCSQDRGGCGAIWEESRRAAPVVPELPEEIEAWKASAGVLERFMEGVAKNRWFVGLPEMADDEPILNTAFGTDCIVTAGHIREVIKLCRTK
jgi:hypothetical protein